MNPIYIVYIIALAAAGAAASVYFISRDARRPGRAQALGGGFALLLLTEFVLLLYVMGMFVVIWALVASLIAALLLAAVLFILWAREVRWRWAHLPVLAGLVVSCAVLSLGIGMAFLGPSITLMRATQIAEANGFRVLLPGWLPAMKNVEGLINVPPGDAPIMLTWVEALAEPDAGVWLGYNGLDIYERKSGTGLSLAQLLDDLPPDATRTDVTVKGQPAVLAEYISTPSEEDGAPPCARSSLRPVG